MEEKRKRERINKIEATTGDVYTSHSCDKKKKKKEREQLLNIYHRCIN